MLLRHRALLARVLGGRRLGHRSLAAPSGPARPRSRAPRAAGIEPSDSAVPEVGWMWQSGGGTANKAGATRANLKQANIKAKKCAPPPHPLRPAARALLQM